MAAGVQINIIKKKKNIYYNKNDKEKDNKLQCIFL